MKKILGLAVAALLIMGLVGGGTWAYFSDTETTSSNVLTAGTIDLEFDSGVTTPFSLGPVKPGDNVSAAVNWELENQGTIDGYLYITFGSLTKGENGFEDAETAVGDSDADGELGERVKIAVWIDTDDNGWDTGDKYLSSSGSVVDYVSGSLVPTAAFDVINNFDGDSWSSIDSIAATTGTANFKVEYDWADAGSNADNDAMGDTCQFDITFELRQS